MRKLLSIDSINTYYGLSHVLFDTSLTIDESEVVFLLGRNGVGKTTTLRSIMGLPAPHTGSIIFSGQEIDRLPTHKIARLGISLVPEERSILPGLTVRENLDLAIRGGGQRVKKGKWSLKKIYQLFPILEERKRQEGITLSGGQQQMLAIARGLVSNPRLLLIDEPVEGLAPLVAKSLGDTITELKDEGVTMLCVDDNMKLASRVADRLYFMDQGRIMYDCNLNHALKNGQEVAKRYLGVA